MPHTDRCVNPMRGSGEKGHCGKNLRAVSQKLREKFPFLPLNAKICGSCRQKVSHSEPSPSDCNGDDNVGDFETSPHGFSPSKQPRLEDPSRDDFSEMWLRSGRTYCLNHFGHSSKADDGDDSDDGSNDEDSDDGGQEELPSQQCPSPREIELEEMLNGLKEKFKSLTNYSERLQILTIPPSSWSIRKISKEFQTTRYMAGKAKQLKELRGVLASPIARAGRNLSDDTVKKVQNFYEENSRVMPGMKDKLSVRINGEKKVMQKQMVLENLKELHQKFKKLHSKTPISFSKFAELRPKHCVLAGSSGTHVVCVCVYHQNCKLMLDAIDLPTLTKNSTCPVANYKDCLARMMCANPTPACKFDECENCPGIEPLTTELISLLFKNVIESVEFRNWQTTDRSTLILQKMPVSEFVDLLSERLVTLKPHHYIAKEQVKFVQNKTKSLTEGEVLVHYDFSENYAFVVQDAAQSFHYNNDQCTVHPVLYYYREGDEICHKSLVILSDCLVHDTAAVYLAQKIIIKHVKETCSDVKKIMYVTDGATQHYKNRFQMANLLAHKDDFKIEAEIHFYATAHGKTACDGIGAILKREARRKSLQITQSTPILTPKALFEWAKGNFKSDVFFYSQEEYECIKEKLKARFDAAKAIPGIKKNHCFIPISKEQLKYKRYSNVDNEEIFPKPKQRRGRRRAA